MSTQTAALPFPTDESSPIAAGGSDRAAMMTAIYREHYRTIAAYLYRRMGNTHTAEDLAAETFLAAFKTMDRRVNTHIPIRFWLLRIATNAAGRWLRDTHRRTRRERGVVRSPADPNEPRWNEELSVIRAAVTILPQRFQSVIALHYFAGLAITEIAAVLDCREGTVKSRLSRGRALLHGQLERAGGAK